MRLLYKRKSQKNTFLMVKIFDVFDSCEHMYVTYPYKCDIKMFASLCPIQWNWDLKNWNSLCQVMEVLVDPCQDGPNRVTFGPFRVHNLSTMHAGNKRTAVFASPHDTLEWINFWGNSAMVTQKKCLDQGRTLQTSSLKPKPMIKPNTKCQHWACCGWWNFETAPPNLDPGLQKLCDGEQ